MDQLTIFLVLIALGYFAGSWVESKHYRSIEERERKFLKMPALTLKTPPCAEDDIASSKVALGSVVISIDYFKRFLAGLRALVGGRIRAYEPLLDRARREALLRMKQQAVERGYDAVINIRMETSRLASPSGKGNTGVEVLAFGTAVKRSR